MNDQQTDMRNESADPSLEKITADLGRHAKSTDIASRPGFKEALRLRLRDVLAARPSMSRLKLVAAFSPILVVLIIAVLVFQPFFGVRTVYAYDQFTLTPESSDALGVEAGSAYTLESRDPVSANDIEDLLVVKTRQNVPYTVAQISDKKLSIAFSEPLSQDEVVKFNLATTTAWPNGEPATRDYNWAFQVKGTFRVTSTIPGDKMGEVPLDSGIEFVFSHENVDKKAFEKALTISPEISGHVESSRRSFVFVPDEIQPRTLYTVTLSGDLPLQGSDETLGENYSFTFETSDTDRGFHFSLSDRFLSVTPGDTMALAYNEWGDRAASETGPAHVKVFRYGSFEAYVEAMKVARDLEWRAFVSADALIDTSVQPAFEFDAEKASYDYREYVMFPESLPEGYYVVDVTRLGVRAWALISSSNLTSYVSRATNQTLFWVNDAATNAAIEGATVSYLGDSERSTTDSEGLASVASREDQENIVEIRNGNAAIAMLLHGGPQILAADGSRSWSSQERYGSDIAGAYWTYLYTDRPTYKPTDTMKFWGYVETRDDGSRPEQVFVDVGFDSLTLDVTPNGTYSGEMLLRGVNQGNYSLNVSWGDNIVATKNINVSEYVKPAYMLSIAPDKDAAFVDDAIGFTVHGEFFEGTPVNGLEVYVYGECVDQILTLDDAGNAHGSFSCEYVPSRRYPQTTGMTVRPNRPEEGQIEAWSNVMMFGPKIYLDTPWDTNVIKDGTGNVEAIVRNVQAINSYDPNTFAPTTRAGQAIAGKLIEITYVKREVGQSYDFVRKQVVTNYSYDRNEATISEFSMRSDENGIARYSFPATKPDTNYRVELSATDEFGRTDKTELYLWERQEYEHGESSALSFNNDDATALGDDQWTFPGYDVGARVNLSVYQNGRPFSVPEGGRFLYFQAHRGIRETEPSSEPRYAFDFEQEDVPNVAVYGVTFEKGIYQQVGQYGWWYGSGGFPVSYDSSLSRLTITVTPDRTAYAPGVDANLGIHVQDANGRPVEAEVNMNVVDEAYYALFPETVNPLGNLYRWVDDGVELTQATQDADQATSGAEKGGGGDRALGRSIFKDNAAFDLVQTDASGNGTMKLALPDNITSWRVTAQALDADGKRAGSTLIDVAATLPFFLNPVMRDSYLSDDQPTLIIRASGTQVGLGDPVVYKIEVPDASFEQTVSATAGETVRFDLPDLELGTHNVTITGTTGALEDKITRVVEIVPSRLVRPVISQVTGGIGSAISIEGASDRYTDVTFMDGAAGRYYSELQTLSGWWGDRADESLARAAATELLNGFFGEANLIPEFSANAYWGNGVRLLPYAGEDFDLTAKVALLQDSPFDEASLASYFSSKLDAEYDDMTPRERAMTFAALASLGEPVLAEFQRIAPDLGDDLDVRLWVALGLHGAGDDEGARAVYRDLMKDASERDGYLFLKADDVETTVERTALAAVLAGALNEPQRDQLHDYVLAIAPGETTVVLERLLYVKETIPHLIASETEFSYTLRGERKTATVGRWQTASVIVSPEDLSQLAIDVTKGSLIAVSRYETPVVDPAAPVDSALGVNRTFSSDQGVATSFSEGQLVKIDLKYTLPPSNCDATADAPRTKQANAPCETYQITDVLPSGLTVITMSGSGFFEGGDTCYDYPSLVSNQRVSFYVTPQSQSGCDKRKENALTYYARVVTPGTYLAEPVYIRSVREPDTNNHSDAATITINP